MNREHPLVRRVLENAEDKGPVKALLALVEQTIPAPLIVINNAETPDTLGQPFEDLPSRAGRQQWPRRSRRCWRTDRSTPRPHARFWQWSHSIDYPELVAVFLEEVASGEGCAAEKANA